MTSRLMGISVDCADAALVARFWARTLGTEVVAGPSGTVRVDVGANSVWLCFRTTRRGKFLRNRMCIDLATDDFEFEAARLLALGAVRLEDIGGERRRTTFADVEGNEFDLIDYGGQP
jgi:hypothetical protein